MSLKSILYGMSMLYTNTHKHDNKIKEIERQYFEETVKLPRKAKKASRKLLNQEYRFYMSLKKWEESFSFSV